MGLILSGNRCMLWGRCFETQQRSCRYRWRRRRDPASDACIAKKIKYPLIAITSRISTINKTLVVPDFWVAMFPCGDVCHLVRCRSREDGRDGGDHVSAASAGSVGKEHEINHCGKSEKCDYQEISRCCCFSLYLPCL